MPKLNKREYANFRKSLVEFVTTDLLGPKDPTETIEERPLDRYVTGILFPKKADDSTVDKERLDTRTRDDEEVGIIEQTSSFFPSALGVSFAVKSTTDILTAEINCGKYAHLNKSGFKPVALAVPAVPIEYFGFLPFEQHFEYTDGKLTLKQPIERIQFDAILQYLSEDEGLRNSLWSIYKQYQKGWKRRPFQTSIAIKLSAGYKEYELDGGILTLAVLVKPRDGVKYCTVSLINSQLAGKNQADDLKSCFQVSLSLEDQQRGPVFLDLSDDQSSTVDDEEKSIRLLYRNRRFYARGHGTSVDWSASKDDKYAQTIYTVSVPRAIVPEMDFDLSEFSEAAQLNLKFSHFAFDPQDAIMRNLDSIIALYEKWIHDTDLRIPKLDDALKLTAVQHMAKCKESALRMHEGRRLLDTYPNAMNAFRYANEAMLMQRVHTDATSKNPDPAEAIDVTAMSYKDSSEAWRPFQLAFFLLSISSLLDKESDEHDLVDLIWFPTGGGKTEAYLGITAFTIFLRRLQNDTALSGGTVVFMRYTLRLLTAQQFQRACTLICACEQIRSQNSALLGEEIISIGLWLGKNSSPNTVADARDALNEMRKSEFAENPFQVLNCPWCDQSLVQRNKKIFGYEVTTRKPQLLMRCLNRVCPFEKYLPVKVVDEDIYASPPTFLFGTVDKFAMLPWRAEAGKLFALDAGNSNLSPELIIQDELHLISGALGTMVGLYETAIDLMCSHKGRTPKIIASTATIRSASDQCLALYGRKVRQFPAPGIDADDSFFSREAPVSDAKPGRLYLGLLPTGKTSTTLQVHLCGDIIQGAKQIEGTVEVRDKFLDARSVLQQHSRVRDV